MRFIIYFHFMKNFGKEGTISRETLWALKSPVIGAGAFFGLRALDKKIFSSPEVQAELAAARAADEAYKAELLRAYKFTYPEDTDVTDTELEAFRQVVMGLDDTFRYSNFDYQNHVYQKMVELYGSPHGDLQVLYEASVTATTHEGLGALFVLGEGAAIVLAVISAIGLPFAVADRTYWTRNKW